MTFMDGFLLTTAAYLWLFFFGTCYDCDTRLRLGGARGAATRTLKLDVKQGKTSKHTSVSQDLKHAQSAGLVIKMNAPPDRGKLLINHETSRTREDEFYVIRFR